jgi:hypothetical protein
LIGGTEATGHEPEAKFQKKTQSTKSVLRLPDLEHAKAAVLNSLNSADAKRGYGHAIRIRSGGLGLLSADLAAGISPG